MFSYVGRLKDSRKGLELFLDALEILWGNLPPNAFNAWIIGGSESDTAWAIRSAEARPMVQSRLASGNLIFWGRIESEALPEFYSRSTAVVVPSFREQFCITAVEAMMCGCPVIATRVGGLQDVVVDERTGSLFERGSSLSLIAVMATYIKCPELPLWLGRNAASWAREAFGAEVIWPCLESLLANPSTYSGLNCPASSEDRFRRLRIQDAVPVVERLLSAKARSVKDRSSSPSLSFTVTLDDRDVFVKVYNSRPTSLNSLHEIPHPGEPSNLSRERLLMALRLQGQAFFPEILAYDLDAGLLVQECATEIVVSSFEEARDLARNALLSLRDFDVSVEAAATRERVHAVLASRPWPDETALEEVDRLSAGIHSSWVGGALRTRRIHPQIELFRIQTFLREHGFLLPRDFQTRALAVVQLVLAERPLIPVMPAFSHGTLKAEHFLSLHRRAVLCDFDHAGYYCGPVDVAHWIWDYCNRSAAYHPLVMFKHLSEELEDEQDLFLGICWILAFQLNRDLMAHAQGNGRRLNATLGFLYEFAEAMRNVCYSVRRNLGPMARSTQ
ncbi:MAG TPA: glycosyltransferase [Thermoanaerobaculia bacterium]|nr:glycosyltransferase [Thermoanaerobaculia bacterium]